MVSTQPSCEDSGFWYPKAKLLSMGAGMSEKMGGEGDPKLLVFLATFRRVPSKHAVDADTRPPTHARTQPRLSACLVKSFAPTARGSGIPEARGGSACLLKWRRSERGPVNSWWQKAIRDPSLFSLLALGCPFNPLKVKLSAGGSEDSPVC